MELELIKDVIRNASGTAKYPKNLKLYEKREKTTNR